MSSFIINTGSFNGNITMKNGQLIMNGKDCTTDDFLNAKNIIIHGNVKVLNCDGNVTVNGSVETIEANSVRCEDVQRDVTCNGSIHCHNIQGKVHCNGSIHCNKY